MIPTTYRLDSLLLILLLGACGGGGPTDVITPKARDILIAPIHLTLNRGETGTASAEVRGVDGRLMDAALTWTSSNPAVATVTATSSPDQLVTVTAVSLGIATITAACCGSVQATLGVTVVTGATWRLDSISGSASGTWQDIAASGSGTLDLIVPTTVTEGQSYTVSSTFTGSLTVNAGWGGYSTNASISILDRGISSLHVVNNRATGSLAVGTSAQVITVSGTWVIPSNQTTLALEAGGGLTMAGTTPNRVARYSKLP